ncbi:hypothetical protein SSX86_000503 [Deinandra increscens subsp. villosa]|uniref:Uncharacterized protein n=1 Tax=Deinandra increscens subsp. villosa TaxID=3103831 RepID=A0AAP0HFB1_9ASTR
MDRTEEDMKSLGFFGIFHQSFKTIFSSKKIFTQITLAFILPIAIFFAIHLEISHHFFRRIENNSLPFAINDNHSREPTALTWLYYLLFQIAYFLVLTVFSVSAVVFTVASIHTGRDVGFRSSIVKAIPKVWKRLFITFVCIYVTQVVYDVIINVVMAIFRALLDVSNLFAIPLIIVVILYVLGFVYLSVVCQLASVVTVMENINGFKAVKKGKDMIIGKKKVGMGIAFLFYLILAGLILVYFLFVEYGDEVFRWALIWRVLMGILCGILLLVLLLLFIVAQTVLYLVCKSYHREAIDKLSLSTFLGAYMAETVVYPRSGEEIQLGTPQPPAHQV